MENGFLLIREFGVNSQETRMWDALAVSQRFMS